MSEEQRVGRNPGEPEQGWVRRSETVGGYLDWVREDLIHGVLSLDAEQRRMRSVPSGWTPVELLSHVLHMEQRWFVWGFLGEPVEDPWGDWSVPEPWLDDDTTRSARWVVADEVTAEALAERLRGVGERTRSVLRDFSLDAAGASGGRFGDTPDVGWVCFHVLTEYARHAGHLDIVVETGRG